MIIILDILNNYKIRNKIGYIVIDNASSNNTLINAIVASLRSERVVYNTLKRRYRYNNYVINLLV